MRKPLAPGKDEGLPVLGDGETMRRMDDLIAFIAARLDEDEASAKALASDMPYLDAMCARVAAGGSARVLREVAALRQILWMANKFTTQDRAYLFLQLADIWSDHPDYSGDWKP